ncbi:hypothetical protein DNTS_023546 [Danionella cerebrum]|uniref:Uncharacterized protein n=1 Tax=Danionella cerebrum TaxID=2873325 RepID=A0A553N3R5_9TELE|nr:hypothetical protein DNTS_023546 [Danionella translucida]
MPIRHDAVLTKKKTVVLSSKNGMSCCVVSLLFPVLFLSTVLHLCVVLTGLDILLNLKVSDFNALYALNRMPFLYVYVFCSFLFCMVSVFNPLSPSDLEIDCDLLLVSKAYHLGQEETDWFEKPRGSRHYGSSAHSGRRSHVKHTYHDYDEPPEDLWTQDDYSHSRHVSSREHRHHSSGSSGRHSSRHSDEPRSSRSSRTSKDPSMRHDSRSLSSSGRRGESRSQGYHSSEYSRDPSGHHHSSRSGKQPSHHQGSSSRKQQDHSSSSRQPVSVGPGQKGPSGHSGTSRQAVSQPPIDSQQGQRTLLQQQAQTSATRPGSQTSSTAQSQLVQAQQLQAKPGQAGPMARLPTSTTQTTPASQTKPEPTPITAIGAKAVPQAAKTAQPPLTGIGRVALAVQPQDRWPSLDLERSSPLCGSSVKTFVLD